MTAQKPVIFLAFANEKESESRYLRGLAKEQAMIKEALEPAIVADLCEVIVEPNATVNSILSTFQKSRFKDRIAIFHYGGHADGYQLLLESLEGKNVVAHGGGLVSFLSGQKGLQLIFLNGCSTQQQSLELVEAGVSAVIGTSQSIADEVATQIAVRFYSSLANGATINRAWKEAEDEIQITAGADYQPMYRSLELGMDTPPPMDRFPWDLYLSPGSEQILNFNLPEEAHNPLFGLPDLPMAHLPDRPFRFLQRYTRDHAEILFGRSYYIRDMYDRATDQTSAPVILFYGQSGVGKSSMLDAGLLPRLEQVCEVIYIRRDPGRGLSYTFQEALQTAAQRVIAAAIESVPEAVSDDPVDYAEQFTKIDQIAEELDEHSREEVKKMLGLLKQKTRVAQEITKKGQDPQAIQTLESQDDLSALETWTLIEAGGGRPLVVLLDQVEEVYTQPHPDLPTELESFLAEIKSIFQNPKEMPEGKLILSYRKEYNPEISELLKKLQIPREGVFLKHLDKKDIAEVITGLTHSDRLRNKYRLQVDGDLPGMIADDLLEDRDSPIAPVLQILLTKMWNMTELYEQRQFTVDMYQTLRREGLLMGDFLDQQLEEIHHWNPEVYESGMALNLLYDHTTSLGTAASRDLDEIKQRYAHQEEAIGPLVDKCQDLYLLAGAGLNRSTLAHDTLAPLVQNKFRNSDLPGQRAARILENKVTEFQTDESTTLDETDLGIVETGLSGMPLWGEDEEKLIEASKARREKNRRVRRRIRVGGLAAVAVILLFGVVAGFMKIQADKNALEAENQRILADQKRIEAENERQRAEAEKQRAEAEKRLADIAKQKAEEERQRAIEEERKATAARILAEAETKRANANKEEALENLALAKQREEEAIAARKEAEENLAIATQRLYLSTAKSLANKSIQMDDDTLRAILAAQAYLFNTQHQGYPFDPDIYESVYQAIKRRMGASFNLLPSAHRDAVRALEFKGNGNRMYSTSSDGMLLTWDWEAQSVAGRTNLNNVLSRDLSVNPDGDLFVASSQSDAFVLNENLGPSQGENSLANQRIGMHEGRTWDLCFLPGRKGFVSSGEDKMIRYFDTDSILTIDTMIANVKAIAASHQFLAGADEKGRLYLWNIDNNFKGKQVYPTGGNTGTPLAAVAFSQDGKVLAFGDELGRVYIWDVGSRKLRRSFPGHQSLITDLAFNRDGTQLASSSYDKSVRVWNLRANQDINLPLVFDDHESWVMSVTFSSDEKYVLAGCKNGQIKKWPASIALMKAELCGLVDRSLSKDEWFQYVGDQIPYSAKLVQDCQ